MASAVSTPTSSSSSRSGWRDCRSISSNSAISISQIAKFEHVKDIAQLGFAPFPQFIGLKRLGVSMSQYAVKSKNRNGKCKGRGVCASLFGVAAPEALVVAVLLVFGPKGLAEVFRNLGKTLRAFQPTIQDVSRAFKSSLEREIGGDYINNSVPKSFSSDTFRPMPLVTTDESEQCRTE